MAEQWCRFKIKCDRSQFWLLFLARELVSFDLSENDLFVAGKFSVFSVLSECHDQALLIVLESGDSGKRRLILTRSRQGAISQEGMSRLICANSAAMAERV